MLYNPILMIKQWAITVKNFIKSVAAISIAVVAASFFGGIAVSGGWLIGTSLAPDDQGSGYAGAGAALLVEAVAFGLWMLKRSTASKVMVSIICSMFMYVKMVSYLSNDIVSDQADRHAEAVKKKETAESLSAAVKKYIPMYKQASDYVALRDAKVELAAAKEKRAGRSTVWAATSGCKNGGHPKDCQAISELEEKVNSLNAVVGNVNESEITAANDAMGKLIVQNSELMNLVNSVGCLHFDLFRPQGSNKVITSCLLFERNVHISTIVNKYVDTGYANVVADELFTPSWENKDAGKAPTGVAYIKFLRDYSTSNGIGISILLFMLVLEYVKNTAYSLAIGIKKDSHNCKINDGKFRSNFISNNFSSFAPVLKTAGVADTPTETDFHINDLGDGLIRKHLTRSFLTRQCTVGGSSGNIRIIIDALTGMAADAFVRARNGRHADKLATKTVAELEAIAEARGVEMAVAANDKLISAAMNVIQSPGSDDNKKALAEKVLGNVMQKNEQAVLLAAVDMQVFFKRCTTEMGMQVIRSGEGMTAFMAYSEDRRLLIAKCYRDFFRQYRQGGLISTEDFAGIVARNKERDGLRKAVAGHSLARDPIIPTLRKLGFIISQGSGKPMKMCSDDEARSIWKEKIRMVQDGGDA